MRFRTALSPVRCSPAAAAGACVAPRLAERGGRRGVLQRARAARRRRRWSSSTRRRGATAVRRPTAGCCRRSRRARRRASAVALAFHVDYWDRLGWKDRFASPAYTERQYDVDARRTARASSYTPQVLVQGRDFPDWRDDGRRWRRVAAINARPRAREHRARSGSRSGGAIAVHAAAHVPRGRRPQGRGALRRAHRERARRPTSRPARTPACASPRSRRARVARRGPPSDRNGAAETTSCCRCRPRRERARPSSRSSRTRQTGDVLQALALPVACAPAR